MVVPIARQIFWGFWDPRKQIGHQVKETDRSPGEGLCVTLIPLVRD